MIGAKSGKWKLDLGIEEVGVSCWRVETRLVLGRGAKKNKTKPYSFYE